MRKLIGLILVLAVAWSGWWFFGKTTHQTLIESWFKDRRAAGWTAAYDDFRVVGYPNRFDSQFEGLHLASGRSGIEWKAPIFNIMSLSYKPNHFIAAFPNNQVLTLPYEAVTITSDKMLASAVFEPDTKLAVQSLRFDAENIAIRSSSGWRTRADKLFYASEQSDEGNFAQQVHFEARNVTPTQALRDGLDPRGTLPKVISDLSLDLLLDFDAKFDRVAFETGLPLTRRIRITGMQLGWGELGLAATGDLTVAPDGTINGRIELDVQNWREVLNLFVLARVLTEPLAATIAQGIDAITRGTDSPANVTLPLILDDGTMSLGPVPLGRAPRFIR